MWVPSLDSILANHLDVIIIERKVVSEQHQTFWNTSVFETFVEFVSNLGRNVETEEGIAELARLQEVEKKAAAELLNGVGIHCELVVPVARKPDSNA